MINTEKKRCERDVFVCWSKLDLHDKRYEKKFIYHKSDTNENIVIDLLLGNVAQSPVLLCVNNYRQPAVA